MKEIYKVRNTKKFNPNNRLLIQIIQKYSPTIICNDWRIIYELEFDKYLPKFKKRPKTSITIDCGKDIGDSIKFFISTIPSFNSALNMPSNFKMIFYIHGNEIVNEKLLWNILEYIFKDLI